MDRPASATPPSAGIALRPGVLARVFFVLCMGGSLLLAVPPALDYRHTRDRAADTRQQLVGLGQEQRRLSVQARELSRGNGLEEQARRQGLIERSERSYVIQDLPQP